MSREMICYPIKWVVLPKGKPIFDELVTEVSIDDEGAGCFVKIEQNSSMEKVIRFDKWEWEAINSAVLHAFSVAQQIETDIGADKDDAV